MSSPIPSYVPETWFIFLNQHILHAILPPKSFSGPYYLDEGLAIFSVEGQPLNIFVYMGLTISAATTQFGCLVQKQP